MAADKTYSAIPISALGGVVALWLLINAGGDATAAVLAMIDLAILSRMDPNISLGLFDEIPDPSGVTMVTGLARLPPLAVYAVAAFLTLKWIYRANRNAHALGKGLRSDPPWAVGWFFIPVAFLWKPFEGMSETWRVSEDPETWRRRSVPALMRWWWGVWLVSNIAGNISFHVARRVENIGGLNLAIVFELVSALAGVVAGLMLRRIVQRISAMQTDRMRTAVF